MDLFQIETGKLTDTQSELEVYHNKHKEINDKYDTLKQETDNKIEELEQKCETEVNHAKSQLMLEHEVRLTSRVKVREQ